MTEREYQAYRQRQAATAAQRKRQAEMERKNLLSFTKICKAIDKMTGDFEDGTKKVKKWKKLFN